MKKHTVQLIYLSVAGHLIFEFHNLIYNFDKLCFINEKKTTGTKYEQIKKNKW